MNYLSFNTKHSSELLYDHEVSPEDKKAILARELPLKYKWHIWEQVMQSSDGKAGAGGYSDATQQVAHFSFVSEFWSLWNHVPQPSELLEQKRMVREHGDGQINVIDALMVFRDNVKPEWEDPANATGGHFQFQLKPTIGGGQIDEYWNNLILGIIGNTIEPAHMITGIRLVDKLSGPRAANVIRIEVWFSNYDDTNSVNLLRRNVERTMATRLDNTMGTAPKCDTKAHQSSHIKH